MIKKILLSLTVCQLLLFGVILQVRDTVAYGQSPEETRKLVRNLAGRWSYEVGNQISSITYYYDLIVTGDNTFILQYKFAKSAGPGRAVTEKTVYNMTVDGDSLEGTHTYWVDLSDMGFRVEEKTFPVTGMISNNGNTINITLDQPVPNTQDGGRWTYYEGKIYRVFSRAR